MQVSGFWNVIYVWHILFAFGVRECSHPKTVPGESEYSSSKNVDPSDVPLRKKGDFLENGSNDSD
jgi:hypothetical protein